MRSLLSLALLTLTASAAVGQPTTVPIDSLARAHAETAGLSSLVVGVVVDGQRHVVGVGTVGSHEGEDGADAGAAPDAYTLYEIGSISKVLTALALADAVVSGEVALETPVADLLPDSVTVGAHADGPIRLVDLATHTSGLPRLDLSMGFAPGFDMADPYALYGPDRLLAFLRTVRPETAPGETFGYSNLGVGLLGYALARRAGTTYADAVGRRVLAPLGMRETWIAVPDSLAARLVEGHGADGTPVPHWTWTDAAAGAGGWRSSADDLLTLAEAALALTASPLAEPLALALTPRADVDRGRRIGLGWFFVPVPDSEGVTMAVHDGGTGGFSSFLGVVPEGGVGVVVLTNRWADVDRFAVDLVRRLVEAGR